MIRALLAVLLHDGNAAGRGAVDVEHVRELFREERHREAESLLLKALEGGAGATAARLLGTLFARLERFPEAARQLAASLHREPWNAQAMNLLGVCHSLMGQQVEAVRCYDAAIEVDPEMPEPYLNAGWALSLLGAADAKKRFHQWLDIAVRRDPWVPPAPAGGRPRLHGVTLCCIDCAYHDLAARALRASLAQCAFEKAIFLSDRDCDVPEVEFVPTAPIRSSAEYSNFVVHRLHEFIRTPHVLLIQYDGFVLDGWAWDDAFRSYDYIGGAMRVGQELVVGNGGFSLRSRRLLEALRDDAAVQRYDAARRPSLEDVAICAEFRDVLEMRHGLRFAPAEIADRFSAEHFSPVSGTFGFHNLIHLVRLHEERFRLALERREGVKIFFRAATDFGELAFGRMLELRARPDVWRRDRRA